jgi:hypothetical protein
VLIGLIGAVVLTNACALIWGEPDVLTLEVDDWCTNPKDPYYEENFCVEWRRPDTCRNPARALYDDGWCVRYRKNPPLDDDENAPPDAGADGDVSSDAGESDADVGADASAAQGNCVDNPPDGFEAPQPVWFGAKEKAPAECPNDVGAFGGRSYLELYKPNSDGCPQCACGPIEGACTPQVASIHFRGAKCEEPEASTTDFSPPEPWDGSCSNNHTIAPGAECPPGSGNPCVQSSYASALPDPVQGCEPIEIPVPNLITEVPYWREVALSCSPNYEDPLDTDKYAYQTCFYRPKGWSSCVRHLSLGVYACPTEGAYTDRKIAYPKDAIIDHRSCSACECEPSGGSCYASFRLYEDDACTTLLTQSFVFSDTATCANVFSGMGVASKEIVDPVYVPGSCEPKGGVPVGEVKEDTTKAITWCCRKNED